MPDAAKKKGVTLRCQFCLTLNQVDLARSGSGPKCGKCDKPFHLDRPIKISGEDFQRTVGTAMVPVLADFYADWCAPCRMVAPLMDEIAAQRAGHLLVVKVDADRAQEVASALGIQSIPTVILFKNGTEVARSVGFDPKQTRTMALEAT